MQEYIENENARLEREQQFWQREIVVKIEYKFCPNLTIIDTPGMGSNWHSSRAIIRFLKGYVSQGYTTCTQWLLEAYGMCAHFADRIKSAKGEDEQDIASGLCNLSRFFWKARKQ